MRRSISSTEMIRMGSSVFHSRPRISATWALSRSTVAAWSDERFDGEVVGVVVPEVTWPVVVGGAAVGSSSSRERRTARAIDAATTITTRAMASAAGAGRVDRSGTMPPGAVSER